MSNIDTLFDMRPHRTFSREEQNAWLTRVSARQASNMSSDRRQEMEERWERQRRATERQTEARVIRMGNAVTSTRALSAFGRIQAATESRLPTDNENEIDVAGQIADTETSFLERDTNALRTSFVEQQEMGRQSMSMGARPMGASRNMFLSTRGTSRVASGGGFGGGDVGVGVDSLYPGGFRFGFRFGGGVGGQVEEEGGYGEGLWSVGGVTVTDQEMDEGGVDEGELGRALELVRNEPGGDEERAAKFKVFETYLGKVEGVRNDMFDFWSRSKSEFSGSALTQVEKELKRLDEGDNMALHYENPNIWIVHPMLRQAATNSRTIATLLKSMETKLALLSEEGDCPVCMEPLNRAGAEVEVLGCCHKVCGECWDHWVHMRGVNAFCPLCRYDEFVDDVVRSTGAF